MSKKSSSASRDASPTRRPADATPVFHCDAAALQTLCDSREVLWQQHHLLVHYNLKTKAGETVDHQFLIQNKQEFQLLVFHIKHLPSPYPKKFFDIVDTSTADKRLNYYVNNLARPHEHLEVQSFDPWNFYHLDRTTLDYAFDLLRLAVEHKSYILFEYFRSKMSVPHNYQMGENEIWRDYLIKNRLSYGKLLWGITEAARAWNYGPAVKLAETFSAGYNPELGDFVTARTKQFARAKASTKKEEVVGLPLPPQPVLELWVVHIITQDGKPIFMCGSLAEGQRALEQFKAEHPHFHGNIFAPRFELHKLTTAPFKFETN